MSAIRDILPFFLRFSVALFTKSAPNLVIWSFRRNFARKIKTVRIMTAMQLHLNAELFGALQIISENESLMERAVKYLKKLAAAKEKADSTLMTKEEFFAKIEKAEAQYARGEYTTQLPGESVSDMLKRCGYAV